MKRLLSTWERPPIDIRYPHSRPGNIALVPASELSILPIWQQRSRCCSAGSTLIRVPADNLRLQRAVQLIRHTLAGQGRPCCVVTSRTRETH